MNRKSEARVFLRKRNCSYNYNIFSLFFFLFFLQKVTVLYNFLKIYPSHTQLDANVDPRRRDYYRPVCAQIGLYTFAKLYVMHFSATLSPYSQPELERN